MKSKNKTAHSKKDLALQRKMVETYIHSAFISGDISDDDIKDHNALAKKVLRLSKKIDIAIVIDYRDSILSSVKFFIKNSQEAFAIIFYAIYFEQIVSENPSQRRIFTNTRATILLTV